MAVENFVFRENWAGSEVVGMKIPFAIFDPSWTQILASKGPNMKSLKQHFNFQLIRKADTILLHIL